MTTTSLFTRDLSAPVPWQEVDAFLSQRHRESPGIEYRQKIDSSGKGLTRFVDTVGAMANSGGGLILIGVEADHSTDRPPEVAHAAGRGGEGTDA
jgi:predicted HTH transcriptional regulator